MGTTSTSTMTMKTVKPSKNLARFPAPAHMRQTEAIEFLGRQVFEDACAAGWLKECARSRDSGKATVFYPFAEVQDVGLRIVAGEYPVRKEAA